MRTLTKKILDPYLWLFKWQRSATKLPLRKISVNIIKSWIGNKQVNGISALPINDVQQHIDNLKEKGYSNLGTILSNDKISDILAALKPLKCHDPYNKVAGGFEAANAPASCHTAHYKRDDMVKNKTIIEIANDNSILKIVQNVLGARPTISNINCWWSFAGKSKAEHAQLFHRDVDDFKFIKLFIYLTDVTSADGPHIYVAGSNNVNKATKIKRYSDDEITGIFGAKNIISFEEPRGSLFLVDTFGVHKGMLPQKNDRLLLQIQYSLLPLYVEKYNPSEKTANGQIDQYVNRLLFNYAK